MAEYIDRTKIPWVKTDNPKGKYWDRIVCESTIKNMEPADVIERSKIAKAIEEIKELGKEMDKVQFTKHLVPLDDILEIIKRNLGE